MNAIVVKIHVQTTPNVSTRLVATHAPVTQDLDMIDKATLVKVCFSKVRFLLVGSIGFVEYNPRSELNREVF